MSALTAPQGGAERFPALAAPRIWRVPEQPEYTDD
jgi:hypothetical protein